MPGKTTHVPHPCPLCGKERYVDNTTKHLPCVSCKSLWAWIANAPPLGEWVREALCAQADPEAWFPDHYGGSHASARPAVEICERCPVRRECEEYAMTARITHGVWGGVDEVQRRKAIKEGEAHDAAA